MQVHYRTELKLYRAIYAVRLIQWNVVSYCASLSLSLALLAGIINSTGKLWKDQRRFLHEKLRQFGMTYMGNGKQQMQKRIMVSSDGLTVLRRSPSNPLPIFRSFSFISPD